ncbi:hypothetical protein F5051DRAFT_431997 [Lentinula edodes]|nr:hypothetical protein F5051DRAFT_431997 [Lentinula edodes]
MSKNLKHAMMNFEVRPIIGRKRQDLDPDVADDGSEVVQEKEYSPAKRLKEIPNHRNAESSPLVSRRAHILPRRILRNPRQVRQLRYLRASADLHEIYNERGLESVDEESGLSAVLQARSNLNAMNVECFDAVPQDLTSEPLAPHYGPLIRSNIDDETQLTPNFDLDSNGGVFSRVQSLNHGSHEESLVQSITSLSNRTSSTPNTFNQVQGVVGLELMTVRGGPEPGSFSRPLIPISAYDQLEMSPSIGFDSNGDISTHTLSSNDATYAGFPIAQNEGEEVDFHLYHDGELPTQPTPLFSPNNTSNTLHEVQGFPELEYFPGDPESGAQTELRMFPYYDPDSNVEVPLHARPSDDASEPSFEIAQNEGKEGVRSLHHDGGVTARPRLSFSDYPPPHPHTISNTFDELGDNPGSNPSPYAHIPRSASSHRPHTLYSTEDEMQTSSFDGRYEDEDDGHRIEDPLDQNSGSTQFHAGNPGSDSSVYTHTPRSTSSPPHMLSSAEDETQTSHFYCRTEGEDDRHRFEGSLNQHSEYPQSHVGDPFDESGNTPGSDSSPCAHLPRSASSSPRPYISSNTEDEMQTSPIYRRTEGEDNRHRLEDSLNQHSEYAQFHAGDPFDISRDNPGSDFSPYAHLSQSAPPHPHMSSSAEDEMHTSDFGSRDEGEDESHRIEDSLNQDSGYGYAQSHADGLFDELGDDPRTIVFDDVCIEPVSASSPHLPVVITAEDEMQMPNVDGRNGGEDDHRTEDSLNQNLGHTQFNAGAIHVDSLNPTHFSDGVPICHDITVDPSGYGSSSDVNIVFGHTSSNSPESSYIQPKFESSPHPHTIPDSFDECGDLTFDSPYPRTISDTFDEICNDHGFASSHPRLSSNAKNETQMSDFDGGIEGDDGERMEDSFNRNSVYTQFHAGDRNELSIDSPDPTHFFDEVPISHDSNVTGYGSSSDINTVSSNGAEFSYIHGTPAAFDLDFQNAHYPDSSYMQSDFQTAYENFQIDSSSFPVPVTINAINTFEPDKDMSNRYCLDHNESRNFAIQSNVVAASDHEVTIDLETGMSIVPRLDAYEAPYFQDESPNAYSDVRPTNEAVPDFVLQNHRIFVPQTPNHHEAEGASRNTSLLDAGAPNLSFADSKTSYYVQTDARVSSNLPSQFLDADNDTSCKGSKVNEQFRPMPNGQEPVDDFAGFSNHNIPGINSTDTCLNEADRARIGNQSSSLNSNLALGNNHSSSFEMASASEYNTNGISAFDDTGFDADDEGVKDGDGDWEMQYEDVRFDSNVGTAGNGKGFQISSDYESSRASQMEVPPTPIYRNTEQETCDDHRQGSQNLVDHNHLGVPSIQGSMLMPESNETYRDIDNQQGVSPPSPLTEIPDTPMAADPIIEDEKYLRTELESLLRSLLDSCYRYVGVLTDHDPPTPPPNIDTSHLFPRPGPKLYKAPQHRPHSRVELAERVRYEVGRLLGRVNDQHDPEFIAKPLSTVPSTTIDSWRRSGAGGPTLENFVLQLRDGKYTDWNKTAAQVFSRHLRSQEEYEGFTIKSIEEAFLAHLSQLRTDYDRQGRLKSIDEKDAEQRMRRLRRRNAELHRRISSLEEIFACHSDALRELRDVYKRITVECISGDESEPGQEPKSDRVYYRTTRVWSSQQFEEFQILLRAWHVGSRYIGSGKYSNGRFPHPRYPSSRPESTFDPDVAPRGLPRNWYDPGWLRRNPSRVEILAVGPDVPLTLPQEEVRLSRGRLTGTKSCVLRYIQQPFGRQIGAPTHTLLSAYKLLPFFVVSNAMPSEWRETDRITIGDCSSAHTPIIDVALSWNARYLAVGYGLKADVWDLKNAVSTTPHSTYTSKSHRITSLGWAPESPRLVISHEGGSVHVITINEDYAKVEIFLHSHGSSISGRSQAVVAVFLKPDVLLVAMDQESPVWNKIGVLPSPPIQGEIMEDVDVQSVHSFGQDKVLVSYKNGVAVSWNLPSLDPFVPSFGLTAKISGIINDVCPEKGTLLVTDFQQGTYKVLRFGTEDLPRVFIPRTRETAAAQPVSVSRFVSNDMIIGGGVGQIILWSCETNNRLQNLIFRNQRNLATQCICVRYFLLVHVSLRNIMISGWLQI